MLGNVLGVAESALNAPGPNVMLVADGFADTALALLWMAPSSDEIGMGCKGAAVAAPADIEAAVPTLCMPN